MKTLSDEVEAVNFSLIVEFFELYDVFAKEGIGLVEAGNGN